MNIENSLKTESGEKKITPSKEPEKVKEYNKKYYEKNKDRILKQMNRVIRCDICEKDVKFYNYPKHCRGLKHKHLKIMKAFEN